MLRGTRQILGLRLLIHAAFSLGCTFAVAHVKYRPKGPNHLLHLTGVPLRSTPPGERCVL
jgi:hypothetical protein